MSFMTSEEIPMHCLKMGQQSSRCDTEMLTETASRVKISKQFRLLNQGLQQIAVGKLQKFLNAESVFNFFNWVFTGVCWLLSCGIAHKFHMILKACPCCETLTTSKTSWESLSFIIRLALSEGTCSGSMFQGQVPTQGCS